VYGQKLRTTLSIDGNFNKFQDQATELTRMLYRLNMAEQVVADKRLKLFEKSKMALEDRFDIKDYNIGDQVFTFVDVPPQGTVMREFISWEGPFEVLEVREVNLVIMKYMTKTVANKTKCIRVTALVMPERDLDGKVLEDTPEYRETQNKLVKEKIKYLKAKISNGQPAEIGPGPADPKAVDKSPEELKKLYERRKKKASREPPARHIEYKVNDFKNGQYVIAYLPKKNGMYLGQIQEIYMPDQERYPGESEKWIRINLFGKREGEER